MSLHTTQEDSLLFNTKREADIVKDGDTVILEVNESFILADIRSGRQVQLNRKLGSIPSSELIGQPYGSYFQLDQKGKKLSPLPSFRPREFFQDLLSTETPDSSANKDNRKLLDNNTAQKLDQEEIKNLKEKGIDGKDIVMALVNNSATFADKTEFSKEKYIIKKQKKHLHILHLLRPSCLTLTQVYWQKSPRKINFLRVDTLAHMLAYANIRSNTQVLVVEDCGGLLLGAVADRIGTGGRIINVHTGKTSSSGILQKFNLSPEAAQSVYHFPSFRLDEILHDAPEESDKTEETKKEEETKKVEEDQPMDGVKENIEVQKPVTEEGKSECIDQQKPGSRQGKGKEDLRENKENYAKKIRSFISQPIHAFVMSTSNQPAELFFKLFPLLSLSSPFVVYSSYLEPLSQLYDDIYKRKSAVHLNLSETWMREYQVEANRTHPDVNMSNASGYLLYGYKVDNSETPAITSSTSSNVKRKPSETEGDASEGKNVEEGRTTTSGQANKKHRT